MGHLQVKSTVKTASQGAGSVQDAVRLERVDEGGLGCTHAVRTVEEGAAVYGVIDAETYFQLSDALIAGTGCIRAAVGGGGGFGGGGLTGAGPGRGLDVAPLTASMR
jgi:hypothetical protein